MKFLLWDHEAEISHHLVRSYCHKTMCYCHKTSKNSCVSGVASVNKPTALAFVQSVITQSYE